MQLFFTAATEQHALHREAQVHEGDDKVLASTNLDSHNNNLSLRVFWFLGAVQLVRFVPHGISYHYEYL